MTATREDFFDGISVAKPLNPKKRGRPPLAPEKRRSARLSLRTYPEIAAMAAKLGTATIEALIRQASDKAQSADAES